MSMVLDRQTMTKPFYELTIGGVSVDSSFKKYITQVEFEDSDTEAGLARIYVTDKDFAFSNKFNLAKKTTLSLIMGFEGKNRRMLNGVISHYEATFDDYGTQNLVIGAIDKSGDMDKTVRSRSWTKKKRSEVVARIASEYGYQAIVHDTKEVHDQITQDNVTDAQFLKSLAEEEAYELFIFPDQKKLFFGNNFTNITVKDSLYYASGDYSIRNFSPSYVIKNKEIPTADSSSDTSQKTGDDKNHDAGDYTSNVEVNVIDEDDEFVSVSGRTGQSSD